MSRNKNKLRSKDKVVQKNMKDGLLEHNLSENTTTRISQKIEDIDLEQYLNEKKKVSVDYSKDRDRKDYSKRPSRKPMRPVQEKAEKHTSSNEIRKEDVVAEGVIHNLELQNEAIHFAAEKTAQADNRFEEDNRFEDLKQDEPMVKKARQRKSIVKFHKEEVTKEKKDKLKQRKEYILGHKNRYKLKDTSTKQDLSFPDNPKPKTQGKPKPKSKIRENKKDDPKQEKEEVEIEKNMEIKSASKKNHKIKEKTKKKKKDNKLETKKGKSRSKFIHSIEKVSNPGKKKLAASRKIAAISSTKILHHQADQLEEENLGFESAHKTEEFVEDTYRAGKNYSIHRKNKRLKKAHECTKESESIKKTLEFKETSNKEQVKGKKKASKKAMNPKKQQKKNIKRQYNQKSRKKASEKVKKGAEKGKKALKQVGRALTSKAGVYIIAIALILLLVLLVVQSCSIIIMGGVGTIVGTSYQASDVEVTAADVEYSRLEAGLLLTLQEIEIDHPGYDEYRYELDSIGHDPHELLAYITAKYGDFKTGNIQGHIQGIFNEQYKLELNEIIETYTTTSTVTHPYNGGTYEVEVEHERRILLTTLTTRPLLEVLEENMDGEEKDLYDLLMNTKGNFMAYPSPVEGDWKQSISSLFGWRIHPVDKTSNFHTGIDIAKTEGSSLYAIFDGVVKEVSYDGNGYGHYIVIEDKSKNTALYAHCLSIDLSQGMSITKGDVIGKVGSTGRSTGAHLHLELEDSKGNLLNPYFYLYSESAMPAGAMTHYNGYTGSYGSPGMAYDDETVRNLFREAEKHLGKQYVFGASGPANFDCSSFVCWVFRESGTYHLPRVTAQSIFSTSTPIPANEAKAGDVIFFTGTYNAGVPVTHVGIYAGNGMMIHAGNPVQYTSIETNYWKNHFYSFGRLN